MNKTILFTLGILSIIMITSGCTQVNYPPECTNQPYRIRELEKVNISVSSNEQAHEILLSIEPGWDHDSDLYQDYISSSPSDVEFKEIPLEGIDEYENAYVLKDQIAIDIEGNIYRRMVCI